MKISLKWNLIVSLFGILFCFFIFLFIMNASRTSIIENELAAVISLENEVGRLQSKVSNFYNADVVTSFSELNNLLVDFDNAYKKLDKISLVQANSENGEPPIVKIKTSCKSINVAMVSFSAEFTTFYQAANLWAKTNSLNLKQITPAMLPYDVASGFYKSAAACLKSIQKSSETINTQGIDFIEASNQAVSSVYKQGLFYLILGLVLVFAGFFVVLNLILINISKERKAIEEFSSGNLSVHFNSKKKDGENNIKTQLNNFLSILELSVESLRKAGVKTRSIRNSIEEIQKVFSLQCKEANESIVKIEGQIEKQNINIERTNTISKSITDDIDMLASQIATQVMMIENSADALTEMTETIAVLDKVAKQTNQNSNKLVELSHSGKTALEDSSNRIAEIELQAHKIGEMISIIDQVSEQTNILAMNAEIEAAHAGNAGRGFAVVAEEIRKLAETSSSSSKEISQFTTGIISRIKNAREGSDITNTSFEQIDKNIQKVGEAVEKITRGLADTNQKSAGLLNNMVMVKEISGVIDSDSKEIAVKANNITKEMDQINGVGDTVIETLNTIRKGIGVISQKTEDSRTERDALLFVESEIRERLSCYRTHNDILEIGKFDASSNDYVAYGNLPSSESSKAQDTTGNEQSNVQNAIEEIQEDSSVASTSSDGNSNTANMAVEEFFDLPQSQPLPLSQKESQTQPQSQPQLQPQQQPQEESQPQLQPQPQPKTESQPQNPVEEEVDLSEFGDFAEFAAKDNGKEAAEKNNVPEENLNGTQQTLEKENPNLPNQQPAIEEEVDLSEFGDFAEFAPKESITNASGNKDENNQAENIKQVEDPSIVESPKIDKKEPEFKVEEVDLSEFGNF